MFLVWSCIERAFVLSHHAWMISQLYFLSFCMCSVNGLQTIHTWHYNEVHWCIAPDCLAIDDVEPNTQVNTFVNITWYIVDAESWTDPATRTISIADLNGLPYFYWWWEGTISRRLIVRLVVPCDSWHRVPTGCADDVNWHSRFSDNHVGSNFGGCWIWKCCRIWITAVDISQAISF